MKLQIIKKLLTNNFNKNYRYKEDKINYSQLESLMKREDVILVDVRSEQQYVEGHLRNAINIPFYEVNSELVKNINNKNSFIIIYCQSGIKSSKVVKELKKLDYHNVFELEGGLDNIY